MEIIKNKNLLEFCALIERYKNISIEEITETLEYNQFSMYLTLESLTGFGKSSTCTLCKKVGIKSESDELQFKFRHACNSCVYGSYTACFDGDNRKTYRAISNARTGELLKIAYGDRADRMLEVLDEQGLKFITPE